MPASHAGGAADSASTSKQREEKSGVLETTETLADYISKCAHLELQVPILAFPRRENGAGDFEKFTAREINGLADGAAVLLIRQGTHSSQRGKCCHGRLARPGKCTIRRYVSSPPKARVHSLSDASSTVSVHDCWLVGQD
jgi:hypothetical protein